MAEKIYVGKAKYHQFRDGGEICKIWVPDLDLLNENVNAKGGVNLIMSEMRNPDQNGNTHTLYIDDFVPNSQGQGNSRNQTRGNQNQGHNGSRNRDNSGGNYQPQRPSRRDDGGFGGYPDPPDGFRQQQSGNHNPDDDIPF